MSSKLYARSLYQSISGNVSGIISKHMECVYNGVVDRFYTCYLTRISERTNIFGHILHHK